MRAGSLLCICYALSCHGILKDMTLQPADAVQQQVLSRTPRYANSHTHTHTNTNHIVPENRPKIFL